MAQFNPKDAAATDPDQLLSQALGSSGSIHQAFLGALEQEETSEYVVSTYLPIFPVLLMAMLPLGITNVEHISMMTQDVATTIVVPANAFTTTVNTLVYHEDCIQNNLQAFNGVDVLLAFKSFCPYWCRIVI